MAKGQDIYGKILGYMQDHPGQGVAVMARPEPENAEAEKHIWEQWQAYLERAGEKRTLRAWRNHLATGGKGLTLPCANPMEFDRVYATTFSDRNRYWDK